MPEELEEGGLTMSFPRRPPDVLVLGPVPPPLGGVSVYLARLLPRLNEAGLEVGVLNHYGDRDAPYVVGVLRRNPWNYFRMPRRFQARVVHYHHSHWSTLLAVALGRKRGARYIVTIHTPDVHNLLESRILAFRLATRWALRSFDRVIAVSPGVRDAVSPHVHATVEILPAFVAQSDARESHDAATTAFLADGPVLLVPAYRVLSRGDGIDAYGLDTALDAFVELAKTNPTLRLAIFIAREPATLREKAYLDALERRVHEHDLDERVLVRFACPLSPAFRHELIVVRPSRTDGDSSSIREALHAHIPVVASDAATRPPGVETFPSGDTSALCRAITRQLRRLEEKSCDHAAFEASGSPPHFADRMIEIYREELANDPARATASTVQTV
jgi:glycosyltransferase involved in cell wall biosynthesis